MPGNVVWHQAIVIDEHPFTEATSHEIHRDLRTQSTHADRSNQWCEGSLFSVQFCCQIAIKLEGWINSTLSHFQQPGNSPEACCQQSESILHSL
jgi:hypothetical protein